MSQAVWIVAEHRDGKLKKVTKELLSKGREIAQGLGGELGVVVLGQGVGSLAQDLGHADKVFVGEAPALKDYTCEGYTDALSALIKEHQPKVVLLGATTTGKDLAPRLAARLDVGLAVDAVDVALEGGDLVATRPIFSGKAFTKVAVSGTPQMASVRPNTYQAPEGPGKGAEVVTFTPALAEAKSKVLEVVQASGGKVDLTEAEIIVSGGRGMKGPENFPIVEALAAAFGGQVGASRAAVDAGWVPHDMQVGQTGKVVSPNLYVAVGISGSIQHLAGMSSSKTIVAINKDPDAPIFKIADYGIIGDLFTVVPELTEKVKAAKQG